MNHKLPSLRSYCSRSLVLTQPRNHLWFLLLTLFLVVACWLLLIPQAHAQNASLKKAIDLAYNVQFEEAESVINNYIASNPNDPWGYMIRGTTLDWKQKIRGMGKVFDARIEADYDKANQIAEAQWQTDQNNLNKMVTLGNTYMYLSKKLLDQGKKTKSGTTLKKCKKHMDEAIAKDPNRYDAYLAVGLFNFFADNIPPGLSFFAALLGLSGDEKTGLKQIETAASQPNLLQADAQFMLSYVYGHTKKRYGQALAQMNKLTARYPNNPHFQLLKGEYSFRAKQYDVAKTALDGFLAQCQAGKNCPKDSEFLANYFMAHLLIEQSQFDQANPHVVKAEALNENRYKDRTGYLYYLKGMVLKNKGKKAEAKTAFEQSIAVSGGNASAKKMARTELQSL